MLKRGEVFTASGRAPVLLRNSRSCRRQLVALATSIDRSSSVYYAPHGQASHMIIETNEQSDIGRPINTPSSMHRQWQ